MYKPCQKCTLNTIHHGRNIHHFFYIFGYLLFFPNANDVLADLKSMRYTLSAVSNLIVYSFPSPLVPFLLPLVPLVSILWSRISTTMKMFASFTATAPSIPFEENTFLTLLNFITYLRKSVTMSMVTILSMLTPFMSSEEFACLSFL